MSGSTVTAVGAEVAQTHELIAGRCLGICQGSFHLTAGQHFQRVGVQASQEILAGGIGIGIVEEVVVLTHFGVQTVVGIHPVDGGTLDLAAVGRIAAAGLGIVGGQNLGDVAVFVGDTAGALNEVSTLQTALGALLI